MSRKTAAPLTHDLLARKGQATAAAWRNRPDGPKIVALTAQPAKGGPAHQQNEPASAHTKAPPARAAAGVTRRHLPVLTLLLIFGIAGGMVAFVAFSPPAADPAIADPDVTAPIRQAADAGLRPAAGPAARSEPAAPKIAEVPRPPIAGNPPVAETAPVKPEIPRQLAAIPAAPITPVPAAPPQAAAAGRPFTVQFASLKSRASADREWARLKTRFGGVLAGFEPTVRRAAVTGRGVFFRLRAGAFQTRGTATALCETLQAKRQSCLVIRR